MDEIVPNPFDGDITDNSILLWLNQFPTEEREIIKKILNNFKYYSLRKVNRCVVTLHQKILDHFKVPIEKIWFVPVGYVAKSGSVVAYFYRKQNNLPLDRFISIQDLDTVVSSDETAIVFLDDYIGSGSQAIKSWTDNSKTFLNKYQNCKFLYATLVGNQKGIQNIRMRSGFEVFTCETIHEEDLPLSPNSRIFKTTEEQKRAREILGKYGSILFPQHPFGFNNSQSLIGFFYSTPNNTLPIFWSNENNWMPLLSHGTSFQVPQHLSYPPSRSEEDTPDAVKDPIADIVEVEGFDLPTELSIKIINEFRQIPQLLALAPIINELNLRKNFAQFIDLINKLKFAQHEKVDVCTSILIVPEEVDKSTLDLFVGAKDLTLDSTLEILAMSQLIYGFNGATVIKSNGEVLGVTSFDSFNNHTYSCKDHFLPKKYWVVSNASLRTQGLIFLFNGNGNVSSFYKGKRIVSYRKDSWHVHPNFYGTINRLSDVHHINPRVLKEAMKIGLFMSDLGHGGLITVGDHDSVLKISDPPNTKYMNLLPLKICDAKEEALIGLISQDGATIVAENGSIMQVMTFLRPPSGTVAKEEVGKGSKHSTASKVSILTKAICIAISVDGQITVFSNGDTAFKVMG